MTHLPWPVDLFAPAPVLPDAEGFLFPAAQVELTLRCTQSCVFCYNPWRRSAEDQALGLPTEKMKQVLRVLRQGFRARTLSVVGGEPTTRPDFLELMDEARGLFDGVSVGTNGSLLDERLLDALPTERPLYVQVTLLAPTAADHDRLTARPGSFERAVRALSGLAARGMPRMLGSVILRSTASRLEELLALGAKFGVGGVHLVPFHPTGAGLSAAAAEEPSLRQVETAFAVADRFVRTSGIPVDLVVPRPECGLAHGPFPNLRIYSLLPVSTAPPLPVADPWGNVRSSVYGGRVVGNVLEEEPAVLLQRLGEVRSDGYRPGYCKGCPVERNCWGEQVLEGEPPAGRARPARLTV